MVLPAQAEKMPLPPAPPPCAGEGSVRHWSTVFPSPMHGGRGRVRDYLTQASQAFQKYGSDGFSVPMTLVERARNAKYSPYLTAGTSV